MMKRVIYAVAILLATATVSAQESTDNFASEKQNGYRGKAIPGLKSWDDSFSFVVLGDFGRVGDYYQRDVAREMGHAMVGADAEFVVSVGDNFYPNGVASTQDYHWISSFESIYTDPSLYADWYVALGNHDYRGSIQAQIAYSQLSRRWTMPAPYYSNVFELEGGSKLLMLVIDTNPFIDSYHETPEKYPDLLRQDTLAQRRWIEEQLGVDDPDIKWKIVVGHHPLYSGGKRKESADTKLFEQRFADLFDRHRVDAYICGHEHDLQIIKPAGRYTTQFLSGAGSEVRPSGHREGTVFAAAEPGFMVFSLLEQVMRVQTIKANGEGAQVLHLHEIKK